MATVPLRYSNRLGFGMLEVQRIENRTTPADATVFIFNEHPQRNISFFGGFFVKVPNTTTATADNPVQFETDGDSSSNLPLYNYNGDPATTTDLQTTGGVLLCFYDRVSNKLQLINAF